jgi:hypothetical protein
VLYACHESQPLPTVYIFGECICVALPESLFLCLFNLAILLSFSGEHLAGCSGEIKLIVPLYRKNTFSGAHLIIIDLPNSTKLKYITQRFCPERD